LIGGKSKGHAIKFKQYRFCDAMGQLLGVTIMDKAAILQFELHKEDINLNIDNLSEDEYEFKSMSTD